MKTTPNPKPTYVSQALACAAILIALVFFSCTKQKEDTSSNYETMKGNATGSFATSLVQQLVSYDKETPVIKEIQQIGTIDWKNVAIDISGNNDRAVTFAFAIKDGNNYSADLLCFVFNARQTLTGINIRHYDDNRSDSSATDEVVKQKLLLALHSYGLQIPAGVIKSINERRAQTAKIKNNPEVIRAVAGLKMQQRHKMLQKNADSTREATTMGTEDDAHCTFYGEWHYTLHAGTDDIVQQHAFAFRAQAIVDVQHSIYLNFGYLNIQLSPDENNSNFTMDVTIFMGTSNQVLSEILREVFDEGLWLTASAFSGILSVSDVTVSGSYSCTQGGVEIDPQPDPPADPIDYGNTGIVKTTVSNQVSNSCLTSMLGTINPYYLGQMLPDLYLGLYLNGQAQLNLTIDENSDMGTGAWSEAAPGSNAASIHLFRYYYPYGTQEYWASVLVREVMHSFIVINNLEGNVSMNSFEQHYQTTMSWIDEMTLVLKNSFPNLSDSDAKALALAGMGDILVRYGYITDAYWNSFVISIYGTTANDLIQVEYNYSTNGHGTSCY